ncbi:MAG: HDOD domain-containing protein [Ignavibacteriales bacterium]|nr:MAG: HDOD domain-containing protein [Ignavibacteriales bacterium]
MQSDTEAIKLKKEKTEKTLAGIRQLPSIPKVLFEVTKVLNSPNVQPNKLAELISKDQGLTTRLLAIANSPLYGIKRKVSSLDFAVLVLGTQEIKDIVTALSLVDSFGAQGDPNFDPMEFWIHSMVVGSAAKSMSQSLGFQFGSDAFVAGILHDLGIMVTYKFLPKQFKEIIELSKSADIKMPDAELEVLGLTHQEVGRFLAEKWSLPIQLCEALSRHHKPALATDSREIPAVIHLCDYMTQRFNIGTFYWDAGLELDKSVMNILRIESEEELESLINNYEEDFKVTVESIKI